MKMQGEINCYRKGPKNTAAETPGTLCPLLQVANGKRPFLFAVATRLRLDSFPPLLFRGAKGGVFFFSVYQKRAAPLPRQYSEDDSR